MKVTLNRFKFLFEKPFTVKEEEKLRNEEGCGYTWYSFFLNGRKVHTHKQYHDFGTPIGPVDIDVDDSSAVILHDLGFCQLHNSTYKALSR